MTYQQKICSLPSLEDKIDFDMDNASSQTIVIAVWHYSNDDFFEVKYEDLIRDSDLLLLHQIFSFLGIDGRLIPAALQIAWENCLFSGNLEKSLHIRSGESNQWMGYFTAAHKKQFAEVLGEDLVQLGYEDNNEWASS